MSVPGRSSAEKNVSFFGATEFKSGFPLAGASVVCMIICGFFLSKRVKIQNTESYYLDKQMKENL